MKVRFIRQWSGSYGIFTEGRECELSGAMLAAAPKDSYVAVIAEEAKQQETPADKQQETPVNKQRGTSKDKKAGKPKDESKKQTSKKG